MQKQVNVTMPVGFEGMFATISSCLEVRRYISGDSKIIPGIFLQVDTATDRAKPAMKAATFGINSANIDKLYVGLCVFNERFVDVGNNSNRIPIGNRVTVLTKGTAFVKWTVATTAGKYIHLKKSDGDLVFDDSPTKADHIYTGFRVLKGAAANDIAIISSLMAGM